MQVAPLRRPNLDGAEADAPGAGHFCRGTALGRGPAVDEATGGLLGKLRSRKNSPASPTSCCDRCSGGPEGSAAVARWVWGRATNSTPARPIGRRPPPPWRRQPKKRKRVAFYLADGWTAALGRKWPGRRDGRLPGTGSLSGRKKPPSVRDAALGRRQPASAGRGQILGESINLPAGWSTSRRTTCIPNRSPRPPATWPPSVGCRSKSGTSSGSTRALRLAAGGGQRLQPAATAGDRPLSGRGQRRTRLGIVGKGVTFDSGGLSLKTPDGMLTMKCDMAGPPPCSAPCGPLRCSSCRSTWSGWPDWSKT